MHRLHAVPSRRVVERGLAVRGLDVKLSAGLVPEPLCDVDVVAVGSNVQGGELVCPAFGLPRMKPVGVAAFFLRAARRGEK